MSTGRRPAAERSNDFDDVFLPFTDAQARWEASRCLNCHDAPCNIGCDAKVDVRRFIELIRFGENRGAAEVIRRSNPLGGTCARVCDAATQCQASCTRAKLDAPIDIPGLQMYAIEFERRLGSRPLPVGADRGRSVAVVGSGPAGLGAVSELRRMGHRVALFDAEATLGGLLTRGIPAFRLPRDLVEAEMDAILATGVDVQSDHPVDSIDELTRSFDAVVLAIGLGQSTRLGVDGEDLEGVIRAVSLLDGTVTDVGLRPIVIGGGTSAMDSASTALRLAGPSGRVAVLYRRAEQQMPASAHGRQIGFEEGVIFRPLTAVERILGDRDGRVAAVRCRSVDLGPEDSSGRPGPVVVSGGTFDLRATSVIVAAGEVPDPDVLSRFGLTEAEPRGDEDGRTGQEKLYVAGDIVGGPRSVCWAVGSGIRAARAVDFDLRSGAERSRAYPVLGPDVDLSVEFFGKTLINPFLLSASPCTDDLEMSRAGLQAGWAGLVIKTTHLEESQIEPKYPLMAPVSDGPRMLAALGNIGLISEKGLSEVVERVKILKDEFPDRFIAASIMGENRTQWQRMTRQLVSSGVDAIECNFSAPQGALGSRPGAMVGQDASLVRIVTKWVKEVAEDVPVVVKVTPQVTDVGEIAKAVETSGGDGICAANSIPGLAGMDVETMSPMPSVGGKSSLSGMTGPAILPMSLRTVSLVASSTELTVSGSGGVESWRDAVAMMLLGATTVQVCTAVMHHGLGLIEPLCTGLSHYLERQTIQNVAFLIGKSLENIIDHDSLTQPGPVRARIDESSCIRCGRCYVSCRDGGYRAISWSDDRREPSVMLERCVGCGLCAGVCPSDSITYLTLGK